MTPFRISLVFLVITLAGIASAFLLEVDFTPPNSSNSFIISFSSDANDPPLVTEQKITSILEGALSSIEGLKEIKSVSRFGGGYITVTFEEDGLQEKRLEILTAIRQVRDKLPENISFPSISLGRSEDKEEPLLIYSISSSLPMDQIVELTKNLIIPKIGLNPGIKTLELSTDSQPVIVISYDLDQLNAIGINPPLLLKRISEQYKNEQLGVMTKNSQTKALFINSTPSDLSDLLSISISKDIDLGDVAVAQIENQRATFISRLNGKNAIQLSLFVQEHENKPALAKSLRESIVHLTASLPENLGIKLSYDDTDFITRELQKISKRAILSILILSALVFLVYRKMNQLVVLIGSVLVSLGISALIMYLMNVPIHLYTIAGLTISFGLVIDNSIMVIDHLKRRKNLKVIAALLVATLTTISAILVIFILPKDERVGMDDFAIAISIALCASVIVSLIFTPAFSKAVGRNEQMQSKSISSLKKLIRVQRSYYNFIITLSKYKKVIIVLLILTFGLPVYLVPKSIEGFDLYNRTIGSDLYQENIRPVSDKILGGMLRSFYLNVFESSGYRTPEKTRLYVSASMDQGHTIEQMDRIINKVEDYLSQVAGLESFKSSIFSGQYAQVVIEFNKDSESGSLPYVLKNRLIQRSLDWGGVDWSIYGVGRGFSNASGESIPSFRIKLKGYNYSDLEVLAEDIAQKLISHPRIKEVNTNDRFSWRDESADQYVLSPKNEMTLDNYLTSLNQISNASMSYLPQSNVTINNTQLPILLRDKRSQDFSIYRLMNEGSSDLLRTNAILTSEVKSGALYRENRQYIRVVSFEYYGSYRFGNQYLKEVIENHVFPVGYSYEKLEYDWSSNKTKRQYALIILILLLVYVICTVTFENLKLPFYIILVIPLSFIGIFMTFSWGGFYFDQGGYAAFVLLAGIVVNATIFILNESRNYHSKNVNRNLIKACSRKFVPIMLTIISTCLGLVPFLIDGQQEVFWFSFAIGVIGGLLFSIALVFVIFPTLLTKAPATSDSA
ncbi:efflux RND transporter permease subunit [Ekhidna sp.]|uniref:efflux RND transporter permease subunit n=1 Tax=Ekhidna sp. TaxID=2608089 RepID=UPI003B513AAE